MTLFQLNTTRRGGFDSYLNKNSEFRENKFLEQRIERDEESGEVPNPCLQLHNQQSPWKFEDEEGERRKDQREWKDKVVEWLIAINGCFKGQEYPFLHKSPLGFGISSLSQMMAHFFNPWSNEVKLNTKFDVLNEIHAMMLS